MKRLETKLIFIAFFLIGAMSASAQLSMPVYNLKQWDNGTTLSAAAFGTLGMVFSDSKDLQFRRDVLQSNGASKGDPDFKTDSIFAGQLMLNHKNRYHALLQVKQDKRHHNDWEDYIGMAFAGWNINSHWRLRAGRVPVDAFMVSEYRAAGVSYTWARPVTEFYGHILLDTVDGVELSYRRALGPGTLDLRSNIGHFDLRVSASSTEDFDLEVNKLWNASAHYETDHWRFRIGYLEGQVDGFHRVKSERMTSAELPSNIQNLITALFKYQVNVTPADITRVARQYDLAGSTIKNATIGVNFDKGPWSIQAELARTGFDRSFNLHADAGYLSIAYQYQKFKPFVTVSAVASHMETVAQRFPEMDPKLQLALDESFNKEVPRSSQAAVSAGVRWDFSEKWVFKTQLSHVRLDREKSSLWLVQSDKPQEIDEQVNVLSISLDFVL